MINKVFTVKGHKIASLSLGENALMFSSQTFGSIEDFTTSWDKKLSLATKVEVKYESIKSVQKEDKEEEIIIKYKSFLGITSNCEFSFTDINDYEIFYNFLEKERYFSRTYEKMSPFNAILNYLIGLVATISFTIISYFEAIKIANGTAFESSTGKTRLFNYVIGLLGENGVIAVGSLLSCFLLYKIWTRFSNPPHQLKFLPPNA